MDAERFVHYVETHMLMFDQRPCGMGVRCYNKVSKYSKFHYGYGKDHRDAVENWCLTAKWES